MKLDAFSVIALLAHQGMVTLDGGSSGGHPSPSQPDLASKAPAGHFLKE